MNTKAIKSCTFLVVCLAAVVIAQEQDNPKRKIVSNGISLSEIRDYRKMFRVNEKPVDMVESTKMMCAPPSMIYGPHYDPGVVYYINETARQGLKTFSDNKLFPVGSIIVKEKQERRTEDSVQIITVMRKVRPGRSEDSWEYRMYDTKNWAEIDSSKPGTSPLKRQTCIECHRRYQDNDYVSEKGIELLHRIAQRNSDLALKPGDPRAERNPLSEAEFAVREMERMYRDAVMQQDVPAISRILADDFVATSSRGEIRDKAKEIDDIKPSADFKMEAFKLDDVNVRLFVDTAIVTGRSTLQVAFRGQSSTSVFRYTRVYAKRNGRWQAVAQQLTRMPQQ